MSDLAEMGHVRPNGEVWTHVPWVGWRRDTRWEYGWRRKHWWSLRRQRVILRSPFHRQFTHQAN